MVNIQVGVPRYHAVYHGMVNAPVVAGHATKTESPAPPKPAVGAGKGFRGI